MNEIIETLLNHRSIRKFKDDPLPDTQIEMIIKSAQMASTSSFIQAYSIIGVKNNETKRRLASLAGNQPYVEKNGHFFVFCADFYRHELAGKMEKVDITKTLQSTEKFMVALIDASLAAQNAAVAAESLGLGICYIGGIRNEIEEVSELLKLPPYVIPLFGLAVGVPDTETDKKPRLPIRHVYHEEVYNEKEQEILAQLDHYNYVVSGYYSKRTNGKRSDRWTEQMTNMLSIPKRTNMKVFVQNKGFLKD
ncbi:oxygen-insensitive NADPH nitroreductase [Evansella sp. AB-P1]|uniref:oxygen-insensitive NADPH nitroreductase n=1 Tax=Evansella sp. AB-P1 TaxID=3037653 RepID=UPI00241CB2D4|nr:oxygen-insensitive NADPH nitroreductase [Evansella sp. AB-P1]MDG5789513.1 oxygen-insensitive NADPH nitroreductase [Evansella sp. AB-P1]